MQFKRKRGFYEKHIKRFFDIICSLLTIVVFSWLYVLIAFIILIKMGTPVLFRQPRPGLIDPKTGREKIFDMYKFRTMTNEQDENGILLPDEQRLSEFGRKLRATSLDELPEVFNILKGDMSIIGPRPQLVRDMVFMSKDQRMRHTAKPGLSGLAQIMGRNAITWEEKFCWDLKYIENVSFLGDLKLIWMTFLKVFLYSKSTKKDIETDITYDYGDALLRAGKISKLRYDELQIYAKKLLAEHEKK